MRNARVLLFVLLVAAVAGCASSGPRQSFGEYFDDSVVTTKVKAALLNDTLVRGLSVTVNTYNGVVQLGGFVGNREEKRRAVEVARSVKGVREVKDDLILKPED